MTRTMSFPSSGFEPRRAMRIARYSDPRRTSSGTAWWCPKAIWAVSRQRHIGLESTVPIGMPRSAIAFPMRAA